MHLSGCIKQGLGISSGAIFHDSVLDEAKRNPLECQKLCAANDQCQSFMYRPDGTCFLTKAIEGLEEDGLIPSTRYNTKAYGYYSTKGHWYAGPKSCPAEQAQFCDYLIPSQ